MEQAQSLTILLVEADYSLRRIIALGLRYRGLQVIEMSSPDMISSLDSGQVDLLVLDIDQDMQHNWSFLNSIGLNPALSAVPAVVLTWDGQPAIAPVTPPAVVTVLTHATCLAKPFDARILHTTIEQLLTARVLAEARAEAEQEAALLASYKRQTAPSIWPIITAAGLLITFAGILLQFFVAALGLLIVITSLLLWSLGPTSATGSIALS